MPRLLLCCGLPLQTCTLGMAFLDASLAVLGILANVFAFTYFLTSCHVTGVDDIGKNCHIFQDFIPGINVSSVGNFSALFIIYTSVHLYLAYLVYTAAKTKSHEKCRWAFMISLVLWVTGTMIFIVLLEHYILVYIYIILYTFKFYEIYVLKKFMDELYSEGLDR